MDRLEAEQDAAYQAGLERMAREKDLFISNPKNLCDAFLAESNENKIKFFSWIRQLYELSAPIEQWHSFQGEMKLEQIIDTMSSISNHIEGMVEEYLENNSES